MTDAARLNGLTETIIGCAIDVHHELGPGMLESAYEACLALEFANRALAFERQLALPLMYRGKRVDCGFRVDFVVEWSVVVEVKRLSVSPVYTPPRSARTFSKHDVK